MVVLVNIIGQLNEAERAAQKYRDTLGWFRRFFRHSHLNPFHKGHEEQDRAKYGAIGIGRPPKKGLRPALRKRFCECGE